MIALRPPAFTVKTASNNSNKYCRHYIKYYCNTHTHIQTIICVVALSKEYIVLVAVCLAACLLVITICLIIGAAAAVAVAIIAD